MAQIGFAFALPPHLAVFELVQIDWQEFRNWQKKGFPLFEGAAFGLALPAVHNLDRLFQPKRLMNFCHKYA